MSRDENVEYGQMVRRIVRAYGRRCANDIDELPELVALRDELDAAIDSAVAELRGERHRHSWAAIGDALGITRQAAAQRFGHVGGARKAGGQPSDLR